MTEKYTYGFDRCRTADEVKARLRTLAKMLHPDAGGDDILFGNCKAEAERRLCEIAGGNGGTHRRQTGARRESDALDEALAGLMASPFVQGAVADTIRRCVPPRYREAVAGIAAMLSGGKDGR